MTADQRDEKIEAISAENARLRDVDRQCDWLRAENAGLRKQLAELDAVLAHRAQRIRELEALLEELRDDMRASSDAECREFRAHMGKTVAGIDKTGPYEIEGADRYNPGVARVLKVAECQVHELEAQLRDSVPAAKVRAAQAALLADSREHHGRADNAMSRQQRANAMALAIACADAAERLRALLPEAEANAPGTDASGAPVGGGL